MTTDNPWQEIEQEYQEECEQAGKFDRVQHLLENRCDYCGERNTHHAITCYAVYNYVDQFNRYIFKPHA